MSPNLDAQGAARAFRFARALHDPAVRAALAAIGYDARYHPNRNLIIVGDTPNPNDGRRVLRVREDPSQPCGWSMVWDLTPRRNLLQRLADWWRYR